MEEKPFLEFFAGSGLVAQALHPYFKAVWANDICEKKAAVYTANHGRNYFSLSSITDVSGAALPRAIVSWASFPCQDLSVAGLAAGINAERSGLVWEWLRIMDEMSVRPPILVAENVTGLVSVGGGSHYLALHKALSNRGYRVGAIMLNAVRWLPHSRPRVFVVAVTDDLKIPTELLGTKPNWLHSSAIVKVSNNLAKWVWWNMPEPPQRMTSLEDIIEWEAEFFPPPANNNNIRLISERHRAILETKQTTLATGYKRTRNSKQTMELRFDGVAGCLRTPEGGSSRQFVVFKQGDKIKTRLLTVRETARLMGAPESYELPGSYNDGYKAMGDAVAVPVASYLAKHLLAHLSEAV